MQFEHIEDVVADIAVVFNWSPADLFMMGPEDVIAWRKRASDRNGSPEK
ncbi:GpE family phage tail protein [Escherichia coli]|nr:GpE family phage tail protein [Escherichia coli]HDQ6573418.1 GpE family phage tail protein [Escherichia coli O128:H2]HDQ6609972.1 GpE family phage tail protein [Escherichia coli Ou:H21]HDQ6879493.1 GpE family phage tail protein [Escherichia coli O174:H8]HDQ6951093.1 GpE family phage tail protein [Escherichia coli Ou:H8]EEC8802855.1 GpE family phage tail protein [Escherichia coli]